ncbi:MAG TPA: Rieske (2Fe-2S) protein [Candidatus Corynebacterium intestinavium]|uniref:Rieske (2Fe-2S) protein n=1 Tax=Candidatus Corynebacterium intestinavium TaxID=2838531 RepID=A0A9D2UCB7_9CORY|nr:Rieske (2Fe-2S) protein [Candidatus Corynebacterium intestinavium]
MSSQFSSPQPTSDSASGAGQFSCSRRSLLRGAALATATTAAGALLAACAGEETVAKAAKADIPVGGAKIIDNWIIAQPQKDKFMAYSTECPHARGRIDEIAEQDGMTVAICPKHGSVFDTATGDVVEGPSRDPMALARDVQVNEDAVEVIN